MCFKKLIVYGKYKLTYRRNITIHALSLVIKMVSEENFVMSVCKFKLLQITDPELLSQPINVEHQDF